MSLKLYNTLSRKKQIFKPITKSKVKLYTCGPTVYDFAHIGNLRAYLFADILKRTLKFNTYKVKHVMNITDVGHLTSDADTGEDKIEKTARAERKTAIEIAFIYTKVFKEDLRKLNIIAPNIWSEATKHISAQIKLIKVLEKKGFTYNTSDGLYFDSSKFKNYNKLGKLKTSKLKAGARINQGEKRNPTDFALWKFSPKNTQRQQEWISPWGVGFPGWHIECSAMSMKYLGKHFDIHTGGIDHIPVHHTNEIAQTESATGKAPWVNFWLHSEFIVDSQKRKMAKSKGNFLTITALEDRGFEPLDYRYLTLGTHYRKPIMFSIQTLKNAQTARKKLNERVLEIKQTRKIKISNNKYLKQFTKEINNDLNTPKALAVLQSMVRSKIPNGEKHYLILKFDEVLGLGFKKLKPHKVTTDIKTLAKKRLTARNKKDWQTADKLRKMIQSQGYNIDDTNSGYKLTKK